MIHIYYSDVETRMVWFCINIEEHISKTVSFYTHYIPRVGDTVVHDNEICQVTHIEWVYNEKNILEYVEISVTKNPKQD